MARLSTKLSDKSRPKLRRTVADKNPTQMTSPFSLRPRNLIGKLI